MFDEENEEPPVLTGQDIYINNDNNQNSIKVDNLDLSESIQKQENSMAMGTYYDKQSELAEEQIDAGGAALE